MDEPPADPADVEEAGPAHRDPSASLIARLGRTRLAVIGLVAVLVLGGAAALAAGLGPGDGLRGSSTTGRGTVPIVSAPDAPEETESAADPADPESTIGLSYLGLCRVFQTELATNPAAAADPAFDDLADDAGGESKIDKYCVELLGDASVTATATPTATPTAQVTTTPTRQPGTSPRPQPSSTATATVTPTPTPSPTPTATTPGGPDPTATPTGPGGKPTKTPRN